MWAKLVSELNAKYSGGNDYFHSYRHFYRDHEKLGKSTTSFGQSFLKTNHPVSKQAFFGEILYVSFI